MEATSVEQKNYLSEVKKAMQAGQFAHAATLAKHGMTETLEHPLRQELIYLLAVAQRMQGQNEEALNTLSELIEINSDYPRAYQEQGYIYSNLNKPSLAATAFSKATKLNPALLSSWQKLASFYTENGQSQASEFANQQISQLQQLPREILGAKDLMHEGKLGLADQVCRQYLQNNKHHPQAMQLLAEIGIKLKAYNEAEFLLESCIELYPEQLSVRAEYILLLSKLGKFAKAKAQAEFLLEKEPENTQYLAVKASAMVGVGEVEQAIEIYQQITLKRNDLPGIELLKGHAYKAIGQFEQAVLAYQTAYQIRADFGDAYWSLANTKTYAFSEQELKDMQQQLKRNDVDSDDRIHLLFALGKAFEDAKEFDTSFEYYQLGNKLKHQLSSYTSDKLDEQIQAQKSTFTAEFFSSRSALGDPSPDPIFIVGLPRAGSTLLEQILASHSMVEGTMELHDILGLASRLGGKKGQYPTVLEDIAPDYFARFGQQFLQQTRDYRTDKPFFIDKMPNNFMHIGLIKSILPNAKIIDARREPIACCFSGYKQLFAEGQEFTYDLDKLVHYYKSYESLMAHWDKVLPGFVLRVQHEDVIDNLEAQVKSMLDFCGLPFETACLEFYNTQRTIKTPSSEQVRQPISNKAVNQWKQYQSHLTKLVEGFS